MPLEIRSALLCDLIRTEDSGKQILVGVYAGDVIFKTKPAMFAPSFWIEFVPPARQSTFEVEMKIEAPGLKKPQIAVAKGAVDMQKTVVLAFTSPPMEITQTGMLQLSMRSKGGRWQRALAKEIDFAVSSLPAA